MRIVSWPPSGIASVALSTRLSTRRVSSVASPATGETLVFNFLSDRASQEAPQQTDPARRLPTLKLFDWALQQTPSVRLRQDYFRFGHDATIVMRKD